MEVRLVQLLGSFITVSGDYALARLELTMHHPELSPPPTINRLADASEETLRDQWAGVEKQLDSATSYLKQMQASDSTRIRTDPAFGWLERSIRQLDQYARAMRWVLTVTEQEDHHE